MNKKISGILIALFVFMGTVTPAHAASLTDGQIQAILNLLSSFGADQTIINNVGSSLRGIPSTNITSTTDSCVKLSYNLYADQTDATTNGEVTRLQKFLARDSSIYPEGRVTGYFGPATEAAVQRWQAVHSIVSSGSAESTGYGYVGPTTRGKISSVTCGNLTVAIPTPTLTPTTIPTQIPTATPTPAPTAIPTLPSTPAPTITSVSGMPGAITPGGTAYVIGTNFAQDSYVKLDGVQSIEPSNPLTGAPAITPTTIKFVLPQGTAAGFHTISVREKASGEESNSVSFIVVVPAYNYSLGIVSTIAKAAGNFEMDAGGSVSINGTNLAGNTLDTTKVFIGGIQAPVKTISNDVNNNSTILAMVPISLHAGQSYDMYVSNEKGTSNVVKVRILSAPTFQPTVTVLSPNGGESIIRGSNVTVKLATNSSNLLAFENVGMAIVNQAGNNLVLFRQSHMDSNEYYWSVAQDIPAGLYKLYVVVTDKNDGHIIMEDYSDNFFTVTAPSAPTIMSLSPSSGVVGTSVTILGSGFTATGNSVMFAGRNISTASSSGTRVSFVVPDFLSPLCPAGMMCAQVQQPVIPDQYKVQVINANGQSNTAVFTVIASAPTVTVIGTSTLALGYDLANKESALTANYDVSINSGSTDFKLYKHGVWSSNTYAFVVSLKNTNANSSSVNPTFYKVSGDAIDNGNYWTIPAGQTSTFRLSANLSSPKALFAGSYSAGLLLYNLDGGITVPIVSNNATNYVTVVGEVSPYITSVTSDANGMITISGARLDLTGNSIVYDGGKNFTPSSITAGSITVAGYKYGLANGQHYLQIINSQTGNSNIVYFTVSTVVAVAPQSNQTASVIGALGGTPATAPVVPAWRYVWGRNLEIGSGYTSDVVALQTALTKEGVYDGEVTGGFYTQTYLAVKALQAKYGIESTGFVGPETRAKLNSLYSTGI